MPFALGSANTMAAAAAAASGVVFETGLARTTSSNPVIDNRNYRYQFRVVFNSGDCANASMGFIGAGTARNLFDLKP